MKLQSYLLALLLVLSVICSCKDESNPCIPTISDPSTPIKISGNGELYQASGCECEHFNVAVLNGTWRDMGRQYGSLLGGLIREFYGVVNGSGMSYWFLKDKSEYYYNNCSQDIKDLISGLADTSGLSLEQQKILYFITYIIFNRNNINGCSQISAWGDYTGGQPLVIGRNADLVYPFTKYQKYICVVVYNPTGSQNSVASVNFIASIPVPPTNLNSSGIYMASNSGKLSDPTYIDERMPQFFSTMFNSQFNNSTITDVNATLMNTNNLPGFAMIYNVADTNEGRVYELNPFAAKMRTGIGLVAASNHFIISDWTGLQSVQSGSYTGYTIERLNIMHSFGEGDKGSINAQQMMKMFDRSLSEGGPTISPSGNQASASTVYQIVTVPAELIMWVKAVGFINWQKVDLNLYFK
jgi:hypothetical protein